MFIIEDYPYNNTHVHSPSDTIETLNLEFHYMVTRSLVAAIAFMSGLHPTANRLDVDRKIKQFKAGGVTEQEVEDVINEYMDTP